MRGRKKVAGEEKNEEKMKRIIKEKRWRKI